MNIIKSPIPWLGLGFLVGGLISNQDHFIVFGTILVATTLIVAAIENYQDEQKRKNRRAS
jgi:hypothetical protein